MVPNKFKKASVFFSVNVSDTTSNSSNSAASQGSKKRLVKLISWINNVITQACSNLLTKEVVFYFVCAHHSTPPLEQHNFLRKVLGEKSLGGRGRGGGVQRYQPLKGVW